MISAVTRFRQATCPQVDPAGSAVFRTFGIAVVLLVALPAFLILLEMVTPWPVTRFVESICGPICHHLPDRTITLTDPMPVCARCAGLYCGWLIAAAFFCQIPSMAVDLIEPKTRGLWIALSLVFAASVLQAGVEAIGWITLANWPRFVIGLPLGLFPAFVLFAGAKTLLAEAQRCAPKVQDAGAQL